MFRHRSGVTDHLEILVKFITARKNMTDLH